ncbi:NAD(P)-binding domain-containing protein [Nannocystis sp. ILAH1]|uniref:NADPH-dependent F420 reductase n=1 Tax=unclassified Nannocystis TaxID=2627009 RepID=UPI00227097EA|nr:MULTISPECIES: NAD(P)-binding domain-containing protein [unclassified Nannocystis]MCY0995259.1 NAD(P)-binding domain-containing protein [Nannocystis sp. ILAH1]MCY1066015.1 NAD(P)-binding domain-containing protein [Nannocystis sp. RBIL2]
MSTHEPAIAIVGPGNVGSAIARRLVAAGFKKVSFGVRSGSKIAEALAELDGKVTASLAPEAAAAADIVFLAVPGGVAVQAAHGLGDLRGKIVVDCNNPLTWSQGPVWSPPPEGSITAALQAALPGARVLKAFNTFGAEFHADPKLGDTVVDVPIAGDDAEAKATLSALIQRAGFHPIDAGPLRNAAALENMAVLWIHLALVGGQGREVAFKLLRRG